MQIISQNLKKGEIKLKADTLDDLWYLSHIIDQRDIIKGQTIRKIKVGESDRKASVSRKKVFIAIETEKTEYQDNFLRILGKVIEGPEDVKKGSHHSFVIEKNTIISITKEKWLKFQLDKLKEAASAKQPNILICVLDREEAIFAISKRKGYEVLISIEGEVQKKEEKAVAKGSFYADIIKLLEEYSARYKTNNIIVASPVFWKDELMKHIKDTQLKKKIVLATCSSVSRNAIDEVLKRPETKEVLKQVRIAKETGLVDDFLKAISKKEPAAYGIKEVSEAAEAAAVKELLITDSFIHKMKEQGKYSKLDDVMKTVDKSKGEINIISSEHETGKRLDGLGGIGAILRYNIT